jgi:NADH dehydrogenase
MISVSKNSRARVVIIGGGFGGLAAGRALKRAAVEVTLVDRKNHHVFQPLLYEVATAALEAIDVGYPLRSVFRRQKNADVLMSEVVDIDVVEQTVQLASGDTLEYDYVIVATGAQSSYFGHPEWSQNAPALKNIADALEIRERVLVAFERAEQEHDPDEQRANMTFVVVGGGPTGVELAGAIAELARHALKRDFRYIDPTRSKVMLIEAGPNILPHYPASLQEKAVQQLKGLGVEVHVSSKVREVDKDGVVIGSERVAARTVLWAAGVHGSPIARSLGVELDRHGRVPVTPTLNVAGHSNVFVIGDLAALVQDGHPVPGVAPAAIQEGRFAARAILDQLRGKAIQPFRYWNKGELATIGRSRAVAVLPGDIKLSGFLAWLTYSTVHLFYLIGVSNRIRVFFSWVWSFFTSARGARLITEKWAAEQPGETVRSAPRRGEEAPPPQLH